MGNYLRYCTVLPMWQIIECTGTLMSKSYVGCYMSRARRIWTFIESSPNTTAGIRRWSKEEVYCYLLAQER
eukprot:9668772-Karenia_brevis.AAC.1